MNIANIFLNKNNNEPNLDIYSRLLTQRIIFLKDELDTQHDFIMSAEEAINYGLIDKIVTKAPTSS